MKCDEAWPSCRKCLSTGRVCEGYSVWGGGNKPVIQSRSRGQHQAPTSSSSSSSSNPKIAIPPVKPLTRGTLAFIEDANAATALRRFPLHVLPADQHAYMEWFVQRTAQKLPGAFDPPFWRTLLPQASRSEPAVLHAVLTLGSIHKRAVLGVGPCSELSTTDAAGLFTLQQYTLATGDLRCRIEKKSKTSVRVALITCAVFVQLEYLRGCYKIALTHLRHGLTLLEECLSDNDDEQQRTGGGWGCRGRGRRDNTTETDEAILHTFMSLLIQARLLGQEDVCHTRLLHLIINSVFEPIGAQFQSLMDARKSLEHILLEIFSFMDETRSATSGLAGRSRSGSDADPVPVHCGHPPLSDLELYRIASIQENLDLWLKAHETTTTSPRHKFSALDRFALKLLQVYHTMACAMLEDCLCFPCPPVSSSTTIITTISPPLHSSSSTSSPSPPSSATLSTLSSSSSSSSFAFHNRSSQGHTPPQSGSCSSCTATSTSKTRTTSTDTERPPDRPDLFKSILSQSTWLYNVVSDPLSHLPVLHPLSINESAASSIADIGLLPPLFYTAIHAREFSTRAEAVRMLPLRPHREGIWESRTAATLAGKILDLEREQAVSLRVRRQNNKIGLTRQNNQPLAANVDTGTDTDIVPAQCRLRDLQIELPAESDGKLVVTYRMRDEHMALGRWTKGRSIHDLKTGLWTDEWR